MRRLAGIALAALGLGPAALAPCGPARAAETVLSKLLVIDDAWCEAQGFAPPARCEVTGTFRLAPDYYGSGIQYRRGNLAFHDLVLIGHPETEPRDWSAKAPGDPQALNHHGIHPEPDARIAYPDLSFRDVHVAGFTGVGLGIAPGAHGAVLERATFTRVWLGFATNGERWDYAAGAPQPVVTRGLRVADVACHGLWGSQAAFEVSDCGHLTATRDLRVERLRGSGPMIAVLKLSGPTYGAVVEQLEGNGVNLQPDTAKEAWNVYHRAERSSILFRDLRLDRAVGGRAYVMGNALQTSGPIDIEIDGGWISNQRDPVTGEWLEGAGIQLARWPAGTPTLRARGVTFTGWRNAVGPEGWCSPPGGGFACASDAECRPPARAHDYAPCRMGRTGAVQLQGPDAALRPSEESFRRENVFRDSFEVGRIP
jgi:hypothetical protein